jgi:hypothetical protein
MRHLRIFAIVFVVGLVAHLCAGQTAGQTRAGPAAGKAADASALPQTAPLTWDDDIASRLVAGVDTFLLREIEKSVERRARFWKRDLSSPDKYNASVEPNRRRLAQILGVRDARAPFDGFDLAGTTAQPALVGQGSAYKVYAVRWPAFGDVYGEGLLLVPAGGKAIAGVVAIPDADQTPEMIAGLVEGVPAESQFARRLAESGCQVLVPVLIDRGVTHRRLSNREFLYRSAFELGRHLIGYEVQKVLSGMDGLAREAGVRDARVGVIGWGEGGLLALYAGALDTRISTVCVSGYFDSRQNLWQEPVYRNVFGLLEQFGDAELAQLVGKEIRLLLKAGALPATICSRSGAAYGCATSARPTSMPWPPVA